MIDLRSDTVTLPSPEMKEFMFNASIGDDVYGEDPSVNLLENKTCDLFGKEDALFVPSGTMANLISVLTHCDRGDEILLGNQSHIFKYEAGGSSVLGGVHSHQLNNNDDGTIDINDILLAVNDTEDTHYAKTKLLCLENTHNRCYGSAIPVKYFQDVRDAIKPHSLKIHLDGARIFNASVALNAPVDKLVENVDSLSCCLSKGLSCPSGSMVIGTKKFITKARRLRKMLGGGMRQSGIMASAGIYALDYMIDRLKEDHINAQNLSNEISKINGLEIETTKVKTNLVFFKLTKDNLNANQLMKKLYEEDIKIDYKGNNIFRMVTHYGLKNNHIEKVVKTFKLILNK